MPSINVSDETIERLESCAKGLDTPDILLNRLLDNCKDCKADDDVSIN